jgi:molecular chaperone GrpE
VPKKLESTLSRPNFDKMPEGTVQPQDSEKSLEDLLADAQAKLEQQRDAMMRALADTDNARKRMQAEAAASQKYALERFAESLMPVLDGLEGAVKSRDPSGVELVLRQMMQALEKSGIREINPAAGERFDPYRHQAMAAVESNSPPNTIVSTLQKGYGLHDRVLRPALVTVSKAVEKSGTNPNSDTDLD